MKPRPLISPHLRAALVRAGFGDLALRLWTAPRPTSYARRCAFVAVYRAAAITLDDARRGALANRVRGFYADAETMLEAEHEAAEIDAAWPGEAA